MKEIASMLSGTTTMMTMLLGAVAAGFGLGEPPSRPLYMRPDWR